MRILSEKEFKEKQEFLKKATDYLSFDPNKGKRAIKFKDPVEKHNFFEQLSTTPLLDLQVFALLEKIDQELQQELKVQDEESNAFLKSVLENKKTLTPWSNFLRFKYLVKKIADDAEWDLSSTKQIWDNVLGRVDVEKILTSSDKDASDVLIDIMNEHGTLTALISYIGFITPELFDTIRTNYKQDMEHILPPNVEAVIPDFLSDNIHVKQSLFLMEVMGERHSEFSEQRGITSKQLREFQAEVGDLGLFLNRNEHPLFKNTKTLVFGSKVTCADMLHLGGDDGCGIINVVLYFYLNKFSNYLWITEYAEKYREGSKDAYNSFVKEFTRVAQKELMPIFNKIDTNWTEKYKANLRDIIVQVQNKLQKMNIPTLVLEQWLRSLTRMLQFYAHSWHRIHEQDTKANQFPNKKTEEVLEVLLVLGDSVLGGLGVPKEVDRIVPKIEKNLLAHGCRVGIINASVPGSRTGDAVLRISRELRVYGIPTRIVNSSIPNDFIILKELTKDDTAVKKACGDQDLDTFVNAIVEEKSKANLIKMLQNIDQFIQTRAPHSQKPVIYIHGKLPDVRKIGNNYTARKKIRDAEKACCQRIVTAFSEAARKLGYTVKTIKVSDDCLSEDRLLPDGIHLDAIAHDKMATIVANKIAGDIVDDCLDNQMLATTKSIDSPPESPIPAQSKSDSRTTSPLRLSKSHDISDRGELASSRVSTNSMDSVSSVDSAGIDSGSDSELEDRPTSMKGVRARPMLHGYDKKKRGSAPIASLASSSSSSTYPVPFHPTTAVTQVATHKVAR